MRSLSLITLCVTSTGIAASAQAGTISAESLESVKVSDSTGNVFGVQKGSLKIKSHDPSAIYQVAVDARNAFLEKQSQQQACTQVYDPILCLKIFPDNQADQSPAALPPRNLQKLSITPAYISVEFKPSLKGQDGRLRIGKTQKMNCLNPLMPDGYWTVIDTVVPILKSVPVKSNATSSISKLKALICATAFQSQLKLGCFIYPLIVCGGGDERQLNYACVDHIVLSFYADIIFEK